MTATTPEITVKTLTHVWSAEDQRYNREVLELPKYWEWMGATTRSFKSQGGARRAINRDWKNGGYKGTEEFVIIVENFVGRTEHKDQVQVWVAVIE